MLGRLLLTTMGLRMDTKWQYSNLSLSPYPAPSMSGFCVSYWRRRYS